MESLRAFTITRTRYIAIKPEGLRGIYWTKVSINTLVSFRHIEKLTAYRTRFLAVVPHQVIKLALPCVISDSICQVSIQPAVVRRTGRV
jgi:hypothetical protein